MLFQINYTEWEMAAKWWAIEISNLKLKLFGQYKVNSGAWRPFEFVLNKPVRTFICLCFVSFFGALEMGPCCPFLQAHTPTGSAWQRRFSMTSRMPS